MAEISVLNMPTQAKKKGLLSRVLSAANNKTARSLFKYIAMPLALWMSARGMANATDLGLPGVADAKATFGEDSTMMYYFMLAEVILVFILYLRNHNPATFLLIPVFIVVTKIIFAILASRAP